ncbi:MAG TPA: tetratricopeptide repeat protein [Vicinamibacterales bacterium]|nr:tetratricopeptide repeat protein [Vicinamibacterales bacterium]
MRDSKKLLSAVALMAALVVSALPAAAQTGRIGGQIKDEKGQPLKGATVTAENPNASPSSFTATTDDRGRYSIIGLKTGTWKITASAPGFAASSGNVPVRSLGAPMPPVDFVLAPGAAGPAGALAGVNTKELQGELQKAIDLANAGQHDAAIAAYQAILTKTPALTMIHGQIAQVQRLKKDYDAAIASYQKVVEADPSNDKAKIEIGMTYLEKGDFANAEKSLQDVATSVNASREVFYNLGEVKFAKGETDEAVKHYERAAQMDPAWGKPIFKLGLARLQKADTAGAIEMMNKVIAADPNSAEAAQAKALIEQLKKG